MPGQMEAQSAPTTFSMTSHVGRIDRGSGNNMRGNAYREPQTRFYWRRLAEP